MPDRQDEYDQAVVDDLVDDPVVPHANTELAGSPDECGHAGRTWIRLQEDERREDPTLRRTIELPEGLRGALGQFDGVLLWSGVRQA